MTGMMRFECAVEAIEGGNCRFDLEVEEGMDIVDSLRERYSRPV